MCFEGSYMDSVAKPQLVYEFPERKGLAITALHQVNTYFPV